MFFSKKYQYKPTVTKVQVSTLDYNHPVVAKEFNLVKDMTYEDVQGELLLSGIKGPPNSTDMDLKLMLIELRLRLAGKMPGQSSSNKQKKKIFSSLFEEALLTNEPFSKLYENLDDQNSKNVAVELLNNPEIAIQRYGKHYKKLISRIKTSLSPEASMTSPKVRFSGFPLAMGENGVKMTLEALGPILEFECHEGENSDSDLDFSVLTGQVEFKDLEIAKKAIEKYHGLDMGMDKKLTIIPV